MLYIVTYFEVQPNFADAAARSILDYHRTVAAAAGLVRCEALREQSRTNRFVVLESWQDETSFQQHEGGAQARELKEKLAAHESGPLDQRVHQGFSVTASAGILDSKSLIVVTHIDVPPPRREETEALLRKVSAQARNDAGNQRYDVLQQTSRPNHFTSVSAWQTDASYHAHLAAPHTLEFRRTLGPMSGGLYDERLYGALR
jgi:quinol monooxygenase YgiN